MHSVVNTVSIKPLKASDTRWANCFHQNLQRHCHAGREQLMMGICADLLQLTFYSAGLVISEISESKISARKVRTWRNYLRWGRSDVVLKAARALNKLQGHQGVGVDVLQGCALARIAQPPLPSRKRRRRRPASSSQEERRKCGGIQRSPLTSVRKSSAHTSCMNQHIMQITSNDFSNNMSRAVSEVAMASLQIQFKFKSRQILRACLACEIESKFITKI
jgi:hypothetical protein